MNEWLQLLLFRKFHRHFLRLLRDGSLLPLVPLVEKEAIPPYCGFQCVEA